MNQEVILSSGAKLDITLSPFAVSKALYQSVLEELKGLKLDTNTEVDINLWKDLFCVGLSSKKIDAALWECMKYAAYNGLKVVPGIFEPVEAREDFTQVCFEVAKANLVPFTKGLSARYAAILASLPKPQA